MLIKIVAILISFDICWGELNNPNENKHTPMPPLFHLDPYEECIQAHGDYCSVKLRLVSDQPSQLLQFIEEYSSHKAHFNHTSLTRGICITKTCEQFLDTNTTPDPKHALEACLNESLWQDYRLKAKLTAEPSCHKAGENAERIGALDVIVAVVSAVILLFHLVGSLWELTASENDNNILFSFSLRRNWRALTGPSRMTDPRMDGMKAFGGIRGVSCIIVIWGHSMMPFVLSSSNPSVYEEVFPYLKYIWTGGIMIQTFFAMSGFLLGYLIASHGGEQRLRGKDIARLAFMRWVRLTPPLIVVLSLVLTWLRFVGHGPLWQTTMGEHLESCRRYWWLVPLNLLNYVDGEQCLIEFWYIYADMQLTVLGLLVVGLLRGRTRWWALGALLVTGLVIPAVHTWVQDLDGFFLLSPESSRDVFSNVQGATFNHLYKRGHTNMAGYVIGAATGLLTFGWQRDDVVNKYQDKMYLCSIFVSCIIPLLVATLLPGSMFYEHTPVYLRVIYGLVARVAFAGCVAIGLAAFTLKIKNINTPILGHRWWTIPARLSFCAYVVHVTVIRLYAGSRTSLTDISAFSCAFLYAGSTVASFLVAVPLWLLIEAPTTGLMRQSTQKHLAKLKGGRDENTANDSGKQNNVSANSKQDKDTANGKQKML